MIGIDLFFIRMPVWIKVQKVLLRKHSLSIIKKTLIGTIIEVQGSVVIIECKILPPLHQSLKIYTKDDQYTMEVYQHINQHIQDTLERAQKLQLEASELHAKYENRLNDWAIEKIQKQKVFQQYLDDLKFKELTNFEKLMEKEQEKIRTKEMQRIFSLIETNAKESMMIALQFATRFLQCFVSADMERKIIDKVIENLSQLTDEKINLLKDDIQKSPEIVVHSAFPIDETQKQNIVNTINKLLNPAINILFLQNDELLAGLCIQFNTLCLQANLRDELKFFAQEEKYD